ncbi:lipocalin family protein [Puniceibacterium sediminis]|uniref:Lipocalin-like domain-containing protein n=1 Tax=Puniceibacterium sediminis TaxID=1608407 RepID=A0A238WXT3_9RHOB|nr:lipocalin family protein [Puniceibacterium sediminis]SNR50409.1 Lipocalin-like domain-containing protein [Puniceibacterium sediminis]
MSDEKINQLLGTWVVVRERRADDTLAFIRPDAELSPTRGGRKNMIILPDGGLDKMSRGPTDRLEKTDSGSWSLNGNTLQLSIPGWEGTYDINTLSETELILGRR